MKILIAIISLVYLLGSNRCVGRTPKTTTETLERSEFEDLISKIFESETSQPTTSTQYEKLPEPFNDTSFSSSSEDPEKLYDKLVQELDTGSLVSSQVVRNRQNLIYPELSNILTTIPPPPVSPPVKNKAVYLPLSIPPYPKHENIHHSPIYDLENSHIYSRQQQELPPPVYYNPKEIPVSYNPSAFYDQQNLKSSMIASKDVLPFYPSYVNYEIPSHSLHPVSYEDSLPAEQPLSQFPPVQTGPFINYNPIPFLPPNGANSGPFQTLPYLPYSHHYYGTPGQIASTFVRSYIPQDQFQPVQFHAPQTPVVSMQPSQYAPMPPQMSQEDIISLIQNSYASSLPAVPSYSKPSFPFSTNSRQRNFLSDPTDRGEVSAPRSYYSSVKRNTPLSYKDQRSSIRSDEFNHPTMLESQLPFYGNPRNFHFV